MNKQDHEWVIELPVEQGISLRDYFAGLAMQGMISIQRLKMDILDSEIAEGAYAFADAMMKARETTQKEGRES